MMFQENPFRQRISEVFAKCQSSGLSTSVASDEGICFEEFLEMMSVFSEQAPRDLKVFYAFKIYGTNQRESNNRTVREKYSRSCQMYL